MSTNSNILLTPRQLCDLELLLNKAFYPLDGFMTKDIYESVVKNMRIPISNAIWPIPIILDISDEKKNELLTTQPSTLNLMSSENIVLATMNFDENNIYTPDKNIEARSVYNTTDITHPAVNYLYTQTHNHYIGGKVTLVSNPVHHCFNDMIKTPDECKSYFQRNGVTHIVAFQTRNPMHRAHYELTCAARRKVMDSLKESPLSSPSVHLLLHPVVGLTKPGDVDSFTRVKCYKEIIKKYDSETTSLSLLPLAMRMAGPREALLHAIIRKNYGCTHFIVGRDHAGPGNDKNGIPFYAPYEAQMLAVKYESDLGIKIVPFEEMVYIVDENRYEQISTIKNDPKYTNTSTPKTANISGTELRRMLQNGETIPEWFTFPEISKQLQLTYPPKKKQGLVLFFTGLSGAGKSTLANAIILRLSEMQDRKISLFDGDIVRQYLSSELGFSKAHRSLNIRRVGYVANEVSKNGGIAVCACIAPYEEDRLANREYVNNAGGAYVEIYLSTDIKICEKRDVKGLYKKARMGAVTSFTGVDDVYEVPGKADIVLDTDQLSISECLDVIVNHLNKEEFL